MVSWLRGSAQVLAASSIAVLMIGVPAVAGSPFSALVGTWSGKGTARLEGGKSEKLACKGYYSGSGGTELETTVHSPPRSSWTSTVAAVSVAFRMVTR